MAPPISPDVTQLLRSWSEGDSSALEQFDQRKARIVEMRFFGGLSVEETAEVLKVSPITVMREWNKAKAWLYQAVKREG